METAPALAKAAIPSPHNLLCKISETSESFQRGGAVTDLNLSLENGVDGEPELRKSCIGLKRSTAMILHLTTLGVRNHTTKDVSSCGTRRQYPSRSSLTYTSSLAHSRGSE